jgi:hypothetical protein
MINHGLILVAKNDEMLDKSVAIRQFDAGRSILHFCGYADKPTNEDMESLLAEFASDEELSVPGYSGTPEVMVAPDELVREMAALIGRM